MANSNSDGWTDEVLIREIRAGGSRRNNAWEYIYKAWRPYYLAPILKNGGTAEQVDWVLGHVCVSVEKQILKPDFALHSATLRTYFVRALIHDWVHEQEKNSKRSVDIELDVSVIDYGDYEEEDPNKELLDELINQMDDTCKKVLTLFREGYSMKEIAEKMGWKKEQSARNKKKNCFDKLLELAKKYLP